MSLLSTLLFSFALLTDIHLGPSGGTPVEDLQRSVNEINASDSIDFVLVSGDITGAGDRPTLELCRTILSTLNKPWYITSGNHETTWSDSGVMDFNRVFGDNRFAFTHDGVFFLGFNSGPVLKMADGHVAPQDISWAKHLLDSVRHSDKHMPIIAVTHYPLQKGDVDNWFEVTSLLRKYNVQCLIGGHYHRNLVFNADGIPDVLGRANIRGSEALNGYTLITIRKDSIVFMEKMIGMPAVQWTSCPMGDKKYKASSALPRPSYDCNRQFRNVKPLWERQLPAAVYASPAMAENRVYVGDDLGTFYCLDLKNGKVLWTFQSGSRIVSTAAVSDGRVIFGSTDGNIYILDALSGKTMGILPTGAAVMGSPVVKDRIAYLGGSAGCMYAVDMLSCSFVWQFCELGDYCISRPAIYNDKLFFGAWDCNLYALNLKDGSLAWKWNNGKSNNKFSPAAVWPVIAHDRVYIAAPDRYMTCLDTESGNVIWRTNKYKVRETAAMNAAETMVYSKCMWDTVVAFSALTTEPVTCWESNVGFGYEHAPCMPLEKDGTVFVGTKNGLIVGLDATTGKIMWKHKVGNCLIQTMLPLDAHRVLITSTDGKVTLLNAK